jgi:hypothetical protein
MFVATTGTVESADKSQYSLFNPTPDNLLRELSTDRPDVTEGPFTVDAGRVQIETTIFGYARSRPDAVGVISDSFEFATTNLRVGLTSSSELSLVWQPYGIVRTRPPAPAPPTRDSGIGGLDVRLKFNVWGNDSFEKPGATAFALLPFVTLPTDRSNGISPEHVEGGVILPFAIKLSEKFDLGLAGGVTYLRDSGAGTYHAEYTSSASLSYDWNEKLSTYYEIAAQLARADPRGDIVLLGTGITYKLSKNLQLDAGVNFGITPAADRINPFAGISARF